MNLTKIKVNKNDVSCGVRGNQSHCAIANALNRTCEDGYEYLVEVDEIVRKDRHAFKRESYPISLITTLKILAFDALGRMSPFSLEIPSHWAMPKKEFEPVYGELWNEEVSPRSVTAKEYCETWEM